MDAPRPTPPAAPRRFTRRGLLKLGAATAGAALAAEFARVVFLSNAHTVIPGRVYRTAQLKPERLSAFLADNGIRTVVNLRGVCANMPWYLDECRATHAANANQEDITLSAKRLPAPAEVRRLVEVLDRTDYPIVFHCARGADRTGLAATAARLLLTDDSRRAARRQLWPRYGHVAVGRTYAIDQFFDYYEAWLLARNEEHAPNKFREWVRADYCPGAYRAKLELVGASRFGAGRGFAVEVRATNASVEPWDFTPGAAGGFRMRYTLSTTSGVNVRRAYCGQFARVVKPGESVVLKCGFPPLQPGTYLLNADLLEAQPIELLNTEFVQYGSEPLLAGLEVVL
jgi:protein tyrosine phosphatase (PTP) superfamily phosphohydrolase (DUF442 family)